MPQRVNEIVVAIALLAAPLGASAACMLSSTALSFGVIDPLVEMQHDSTAQIHVTCDPQATFTISLSTGAGSYNQRALVSGANLLNYNLYIDPQRTMIWGDGSGTTRTVSGSADSAGTSHTIYGSIPWQPRAVPGVYSDTIVITVSY